MAPGRMTPPEGRWPCSGGAGVLFRHEGEPVAGGTVPGCRAPAGAPCGACRPCWWSLLRPSRPGLRTFFAAEVQLQTCFLWVTRCHPSGPCRGPKPARVLQGDTCQVSARGPGSPCEHSPASPGWPHSGLGGVSGHHGHVPRWPPECTALWGHRPATLVRVVSLCGQHEHVTRAVTDCKVTLSVSLRASSPVTSLNTV